MKIDFLSTNFYLAKDELNTLPIFKEIINDIIRQDCYIIEVDWDFNQIFHALEEVVTFEGSLLSNDNKAYVTACTGVKKHKGVYLARIKVAEDRANMFIFCPHDKKDVLPKFFDDCVEMYRQKIELENKIYQEENLFEKLFLKKGQKEEIINDVQTFLNSEKIYKEELKIPWKRGIVFYGPPGNGKTLLIKALRSYFNLKAMNLFDKVNNHGDILVEEAKAPLNILIKRDGKFNIMQQRVFLRDLYHIKYPSKKLPTLYYLEDLDKAVGKNTADFGKVPLSSLLQFLDGVNQLSDVLIVATTNYIDELAEALISRPGRFDTIYKIDKPDNYQVKNMFDYYNINIENEELIVNQLQGSSMAFVEEFIKVAKTVYRRNKLTEKEAFEILSKMKNHMQKYAKTIQGFKID